MEKNPVRTAWAVLLTSFIIFCLLAVSLPLGIRWYLLHSAKNKPGLLRVTSGTVLLVPGAADEPIAVVDARPVEEDSLIQTDQTSQATLVFRANEASDSLELATVQIYPNVQARLVQSTHPRFPLSNDPDRIILEVRGGRVRVNASDYLPRGLSVEVRTPQAVVRLNPGSYAVDVSNDQTQVVTRAGEAIVEAEGQSAIVSAGQSSLIASGQAPGEPAPGAENLISGGNFNALLGPPDWLVSHYPEDDPTAGNAEIVNSSGRNAARFYRINQPPTHTEVGITQVLDRSVHDYESLNLQLDVMLRWQSLPGAGEQSSEFPLMFWLDYEDIYGKHQFWAYGFYYRDPSPQWVVTGGQKISQNIWFPFESGNLFERLPMEGRPLPAKINWLKIYASGHNYDSMVSEVRLIAR